MSRVLHSALAALLITGQIACSSAGATTASIEPQQDSTDSGSGSDDDLKSYADVITEEAVTDSGMFIVHEVDDKLYYEIPNDMLDRELLLVTRVARTANGVGYGGQKFGTRTVVWQRHDKEIFLRVTSHVNVADDTLSIARAVENSNLEPIVETFEIEALNDDSSSVVIDVTSLFESDVPMLGLSSGRRTTYGVRKLDGDRSFIQWAHSYPRNIEVRNVLTYEATKAPSETATGTITLEMNHSMIMLPDEPMMPRLWDDRVGYFSLTQTDFGRPVARAESRRYITRWRLEPSDPAAFARGEVVDPVEPIIYYIDASTPEKWRPYLKQGIEDWQVAFEAAGFSNAIIARDAPTPEEDPEYSPEDIRYSVIRYFTSSVQNASGPHVHDPRSGEILESDINWYHNVMNLLRNWYFIQTAAANPAARHVNMPDSVMGELVRFVSAHEVGHTLGLPHNMKASSSVPVDSLRSPSYSCSMGVAPAIMDYARFNYVAQPGDDGVCFMPGVGVYDIYAIRWGYRPIPSANTPDEEREVLNGWITQHDGDPTYLFGNGSQYDPTSLTEAIGDDAMRASDFGINNLATIVDSLLSWAYEEGDDFSQLNELYQNVVGQWNRYIGHVLANVGGVHRTSLTFGQQGTMYEPVPQETQQRAMEFMARQVFATPTWMINQDVLSRIEHAGVVERIRRRQVGAVNNLLNPQRMQRLVEAEALHGDAAYTLGEMMTDLRGGIWGELSRGRTIDPYRRNLQRGYIERMRWLMENEAPPVPAFFAANATAVTVSQSDIRPFVRGELNAVRSSAQNALRRRLDQATRYHLDDVVARIDDILDGDD